jgi:DNA-binding LacI/PurR family transcriptional regulator
MTLDLQRLAELAGSLTLAARTQLEAAGSITGPADDRRYYAQASAFVLLARTLHLLDEQAICVLSNAPEAARMLLRQIIELDITGRYLLAYPDQVEWAVDETYRQRRAQLAASGMHPSDPLVVSFSQEHPIAKGHPRINLERMAARVPAKSRDELIEYYFRFALEQS